MATIGDLVVNLIGNVAPLKGAFAQAQGLLGGFGASIAGLLGGGVAIAAAQEAAQAQAKLGAVLASTGGAAGVSAGEISQLANELMAVTNFGDDATVSAAGVLATFTKIKGDVFKQALMSAQDLSSVLGTDLQGSVIQIGKALNDPIKGITALTKAGVSFTAAQKAQIKELVESGDLMGAQKIILSELKTEFGGAAKAMADPMIQLRNAVGEVAEELGNVLLPLMRAFADNVIPFLAKWGQGIASVGAAILSLIGVMKIVTVVQKSIAVGQALILSLGGPAGWATLALGAAVFAGAVVGIDRAMAGVKAQVAGAAAKAGEFQNKFKGAVGDIAVGAGAGKQALEEFNRALNNTASPFEKLNGQLDDLKATAEDLGSRAMADFEMLIKPDILERAGHAKEKILGLRREIAVLAGTATEADQALFDMAMSGAWSAEQLQQFEDLSKQHDELKKSKSAMDDLKSAAKRISEEMMTPEEKFEKKMADLNELREKELIGQETFDRASAQAMEDRDKELGTDAAGRQVGGAAAMERGSKEAFSSIFAGMRGAENPQEELVSLQKEANDRLQEQINVMEDIADGLDFDVAEIA